MKGAFKVKQKAFFTIFKELSIIKKISDQRVNF